MANERRHATEQTAPFERMPEHDRRVGRGDDFAGDAWRNAETGQVMWSGVGVDLNAAYLDQLLKREGVDLPATAVSEREHPYKGAEERAIEAAIAESERWDDVEFADPPNGEPPAVGSGVFGVS